jgi:hypothetical protein
VADVEFGDGTIVTTLAHGTGLAAMAYGGEITAPEVLQVSPRPDGKVELWLADVGGAGGFDWPVPRLARFAYELGAGQARWAGRVPDTPGCPAAGWRSISTPGRAVRAHRRCRLGPPQRGRRLACGAPTPSRGCSA